MKFISLFSGIGGFDLGLERAGMECVAQVERDKQAASVLERHWPNVTRSGDVCTFKKEGGLSADLICGGFPCQDLSVAGKRAGLAGKRSGLFWEFMRIVEDFTPKWVLIENVPGLLSSNEGRDMSAVVMALAERGYGWAYRVLDSQYFGLAQRRERVFIVGCLGDVRRAGEVLFESESLPWSPPPRRQERKSVAPAFAPSLSASGRGTSRAGESRGQDCLIPDGGGSVAKALTTEGYFDAETETFVTSGHACWQEVASPITAGYKKGPGVNDGKKGSPQNLILTEVTHTIRGEGSHDRRLL